MAGHGKLGGGPSDTTEANRPDADKANAQAPSEVNIRRD
jgi:hypothetical protein